MNILCVGKYVIFDDNAFAFYEQGHFCDHVKAFNASSTVFYGALKA